LFGIIDVTKKKINNKKAMSAILPAFTEGVVEFLIIENGLVFTSSENKKSAKSIFGRKP
tara:strand:- start:11943 stop:12119 length:177 start_codon:yes stop_codon:yes gene_type:complete